MLTDFQDRNIESSIQTFYKEYHVIRHVTYSNVFLHTYGWNYSTTFIYPKYILYTTFKKYNKRYGNIYGKNFIFFVSFTTIVYTMG